MVELFLQLVDRSIKLLEHRETVDRRMFEDHVQPLFDCARLVFEDYRKGLGEALHRHEHGEQVGAFLRAAAETQQLDRQALRDYGTAIANLRDRWVARTSGSGLASEFATACFGLATRTAHYPHRIHLKSPTEMPFDIARRLESKSAFSSLSAAVDWLEHLPPSDSASRAVRVFIREELDRLNRQWNEVSNQYYALRVHCLR